VQSLVTEAEEKMDQQLTKFWEIEEVDTQKEISEQDKICEEFFNHTTKRTADGRYEVRLPFKEDPTILGDSRRKAVARFLQLERRFRNNPHLAMEYKQFMKQYLDLHHMEPVNPYQVTQRTSRYYIPHQPVIRPGKEIRVVFNASCPTDTGRSLNDCLYVGPKLQTDIINVLLPWRIHRIALTADIEKMYRQINLAKEDRLYHTILWRDSEDQLIQEFQMTTVTYGTTSAPYLAIRTLQRLAADEEKNHPQSATILRRNFYVDDLFH